MYETVIGLEIHIQLNTNSKAFCRDSNDTSSPPNTNISVISLAHPGTLPRMNVAHIEKALKLGLAFGSEINEYNYFDRKNYFYPDLPKGYQITQDKQPYCRKGAISFISENTKKSIRLHHIHMEEDAGKSIHDQHELYSLVDINRAGVPLLEVVTEPDFRSGQEVSDFLTELQKVVQYLDISDANMEEGSFRCDCNVSVRKIGVETLGERCEIKNMNSRRNAKNAIEYEAKRQIDVLEKGGSISKTTMLYDPVAGETRPMRKKESENDYRYFSEPDLPPIQLDATLISNIKKSLVALPVDIYETLTTSHKVAAADAEVLTEDMATVQYFKDLVNLGQPAKDAAEFIVQRLLPHSKKEGKSLETIASQAVASAFITFTSEGKVAKSAIYQHVFPTWIEDTNVDPMDIAKTKNLVQSDDQSFLDSIIQDVLSANAAKVTEYKKGKKGLLGFFMGQVMQKSAGKADPTVLQSKMEKALNE